MAKLLNSPGLRGPISSPVIDAGNNKNRESIDQESLVEVFSELIVKQNIGELTRVIFYKIRNFISFDIVALFVPHGADGVAKSEGLIVFEENCEVRVSSFDCAYHSFEFIRKNPSLKIADVSHLSKDLPEVAALLRRHGVRSCCMVPLVIADQPVGILFLCAEKADAYLTPNISILKSVAAHVAVALDRMASAREAGHKQRLLTQDRKRLLMVRQVSDAIVSELDLRKLLYKISSSIKEIIGFEYADLLLYNSEKDLMVREAVGFNGRGLMKEGFNEPFCQSPAHISFKNREVILYGMDKLIECSKEVEAIKFILAEGFQEACCIPLLTQGRALGVLNVLSSEEGRFTSDCVSLLVEIAKPIAVAVDNALAYREISEMKNKLAREKEYLEGQIHTRFRFDEIIGKSSAINKVLEQIETVADTNANVLIMGETGTGKELIARALHRLSERKDSTFVKLNCAAIPSELLESELFGHEKGAFTGAMAARMGLMELAHKGTLFLDEVGDIPLNLQPKLLRVLQERQLSRVGGSRTIDVDFRLIAATNRDLRQMSAEHEFRSDLYYRLNVFPITAPPLRERREDIPLLVHHFVQKYTRARKRHIESIPSEVMQSLMQWDWPGNIRELENLMERSVILSKGSVLIVPIADIQSAASICPRPVSASGVAHLDDAVLSPDEICARDLILQALKESGGTVAGPNGAARRLGMKRTTLLWKMQRLGIRAHREFR